jgi:hypothetical protein
MLESGPDRLARGALAAERGGGEREADERCERIVAFRGVDSEARAMSATSS